MALQLMMMRDVYAAGRDAGHRSMRAGGRKKWNRADHAAACAEFERLAPHAVDCAPAMRAAILAGAAKSSARRGCTCVYLACGLRYEVVPVHHRGNAKPMTSYFPGIYLRIIHLRSDTPGHDSPRNSTVSPLGAPSWCTSGVPGTLDFGRAAWQR